MMLKNFTVSAKASGCFELGALPFGYNSNHSLPLDPAQQSEVDRCQRILDNRLAVLTVIETVAEREGDTALGQTARSLLAVLDQEV